MKIFICDFLFSAAGRLLGWMSTEVVSWVVQARTVANSHCVGLHSHHPAFNSGRELSARIVEHRDQGLVVSVDRE